MNKLKAQLGLLTIMCIILLWILIISIVQMFLIDIYVGIIGVVVSIILSVIMIYFLWKKPSMKDISKIAKKLYNKVAIDDDE